MTHLGSSDDRSAPRGLADARLPRWLAGERGIDVIGDVHGQAARLERLLERLGYAPRSGVWRHPERNAVFLGDLVDRGPEQMRTVAIVRRMVDDGGALCLMGNHEFNAIGYARRGSDGRPLRRRSPANGRQHVAFLEEVGLDSPTHHELVEWFVTLPTHVEARGVRFVHACWSPDHIAVLGQGGAGFLDRDRLEAYFRKGERERKAAEIVLKGPETRLPTGLSYLDGYGNERDVVRLAWWKRDAEDLRAMVIAEGVPLDHLAGVPAPSEWVDRQREPLTFIGHYWLRGTPRPVADDVVCLDYSVAADGHLVAYRLEPGDREARADRFLHV